VLKRIVTEQFDQKGGTSASLASRHKRGHVSATRPKQR
jgi:hypothetical protein